MGLALGTNSTNNIKKYIWNDNRQRCSKVYIGEMNLQLGTGLFCKRINIITLDCYSDNIVFGKTSPSYLHLKEHIIIYEMTGW